MVYRLCRRGKIPCRKEGRGWRFEEGEIEAWLVLLALREALILKTESALVAQDKG